MRLDDLCAGIVADVDGCLGCAVVDLTTGLSLASKVVPGVALNHAAMEVMAAASVDYFRGRNVWQLQLAMSSGPPETSAALGFVREIQTTTEDTYHFMSVVPGREDVLFILITDKTANLGLGWIAMRDALGRLHEVYEAARGPQASAQAEAAVPAGLPRLTPHTTDMNPSFGADRPDDAGSTPVFLDNPAGVENDPAKGPHPVRGYRELRVGLEEPQARTGDPEAGHEMFSTRWRGGHGVRGRSPR